MGHGPKPNSHGRSAVLTSSGGEWLALANWLLPRVGPDDRRYRYAAAFAELLLSGALPTTRQSEQATAIWVDATMQGYVPGQPSVSGAPSYEAEPVLPVSSDSSTGVPDVEDLSTPDRWLNLRAALEEALKSLPVSSWFALWLASDHGMPHNDGLSYSVEARVLPAGIALRCIGPQHITGDAQLPPSAVHRLRDLGWRDHENPRRMLRISDYPRSDEGIAEAADAIVRLLTQVYGADDPRDLHVEVREELRQVALGFFGGLPVLPPEHFGLEVAPPEVTEGSVHGTSHRSASKVGDSRGVVMAWFRRRLDSAPEVTWQPADEFAVRVASCRRSPQSGLDPVIVDVGDSGLVVSITWPALGSRMGPPPLGNIRRAVEIRNAALDRDRMLDYRFRRDMRFAGSVFSGISLFTVVSAEGVSPDALDERLALLATRADELSENDLWEMGVWRPPVR